ncbi:MAG: hypothetical protein JW929_11185 [Anaerolineales bacterium]|nr:hypothetical protein [Anaerolineales bacterium]
MAKSSLIVGVLTFVLIFVGGLLSSVCCLASPFLALFLGLAAGYLCAMFEKPADAEKAAVRGAMAGGITGGVALVAQFISQTIVQYILSQSGNLVACIPGFCTEGSAPVDLTHAMLAAVFNSCFWGLILLALMAGFGAAGAVIWIKLSAGRKPDILAGDSGSAPSA